MKEGSDEGGQDERTIPDRHPEERSDEGGQGERTSPDRHPEERSAEGSARSGLSIRRLLRLPPRERSQVPTGALHGRH